jgi:hypothetical protein
MPEVQDCGTVLARRCFWTLGLFGLLVGVEVVIYHVAFVTVATQSEPGNACMHGLQDWSKSSRARKLQTCQLPGLC